MVKRHLELDLARRNIVVNREVEVRRAASGTGKRTDIYARAIHGDLPAREARKLTVVIETKRCSNAELRTALGDQLVDDYLKPLGLKHGIYLVGRFGCTTQPCCRNKTLHELQAELSEQAKAQLPQYSVVSIVLDTSLPTSMSASSSKGNRGGRS
jgi:hypothetical protein